MNYIKKIAEVGAMGFNLGKKDIDGSLRLAVVGAKSILSKSIVIFVLALSFGLSICSDILALVFIFVSFLSLKIIEKIVQSQLIRAESFLREFSWAAIRQNCRRAIEYIKCARMIEFGYEFRTNTNIILHDQRELKGQFEQTVDQDSLKIQHSIVSIVKKLIELKVEIKALMMLPCQDEAKFQDQFEVPLTFDQCFKLYASVQGIISKIENLSFSFTFFKNSPFTPSFKLIKAIYFIQRHLTGSVIWIKKELQLIENNIFWKDSLNIGFTKDLSKEERLKKLQTLFQSMSKLRQYQNSSEQSFKRQEMQEETTFSSGTLNQVKQANQANDSFQINQQLNNPNKKRMFMQQLDALLMLGLARKRQEEAEQTQESEL